MGLSNEQYKALKTASERWFSEKEFGYPDTEDAMSAVFGGDRSSTEAHAWAAYWLALSSMDEKRGAGEPYVIPKVCDSLMLRV